MKPAYKALYERNQQMIAATFLKLVNELKRKPTTLELAKESGMTTYKIRKYIKDLDFQDYSGDLKVLTNDVMMGLYKKAKEGKAPEVKLWLQVVENWKEAQDVKHSGEIKIEKINFVMDEIKENKTE